jgi:RNA polymerase sigma-70 factor (ECF subfamily)
MPCPVRSLSGKARLLLYNFLNIISAKQIYRNDGSMMVITTNSDESLMIAVREGTYAELETLFDRHHLSLYQFFYRMTGDRIAGESLVQDVFCRILKFRDTFRDECRFKSWLFRIARNAHHEAFRKQETAFTLDDDPKPMRKVSPAGADVARKDKSAALRDALLKLPEARRELVVFSQYLQMTPDEIAELLDVDLPAANVGVHRAMMELRDLYRALSE